MADFKKCGLRSAEENGGEEWIRTTEGISQQIYSLPRLATSVPLRRDWSGRWESNPPHQLGRLAHYHYATPASNAPRKVHGGRASVKIKPEPRLCRKRLLGNATGSEDRVGHAVEDFFVRRADGSENAAEFGVVAHDEIIRAEADARFEVAFFVRFEIGVTTLDDPRFPEAL